MTLLGLLLAAAVLPKVLSGLLVFFHILLCLFLIAVVLLQSGRAGDLSSAFGGGQSQANIAAMSSENILTRATKMSAFSFMVTSMLLALFAHGESGADSVLDAVPEPPAAVAPLEPGGDATPPGSTQAGGQVGGSDVTPVVDPEVEAEMDPEVDPEAPTGDE